MLEKTLENPLDSKGIKSVSPKWNLPWIFIERIDAEALIVWPPHVKSWLTGKDSDAVKDCGQEEKDMHIVYTYIYCCCSVAKSYLTLWLYELQHTRLPCPFLPSNHLILCGPLLLYFIYIYYYYYLYNE